jgi:hypothetical protein
MNKPRWMQKRRVWQTCRDDCTDDIGETSWHRRGIVVDKMRLLQPTSKERELITHGAQEVGISRKPLTSTNYC